MFEKVTKYIRENLQLLDNRPDGTYCFRLHSYWVYCVSKNFLKLAANISGYKRMLLGTCLGKVNKFQLHIRALDYFTFYGKYKVWIKLEQSSPSCMRIWVKSLKILLSMGSGGVLHCRSPFGFWGGTKLYTRLQESRPHGNCGILSSRHWGICMTWRNINLKWNHPTYLWLCGRAKLCFLCLWRLHHHVEFCQLCDLYRDLLF